MSYYTITIDDTDYRVRVTHWHPGYPPTFDDPGSDPEFDWEMVEGDYPPDEICRQIENELLEIIPEDIAESRAEMMAERMELDAMYGW